MKLPKSISVFITLWGMLLLGQTALFAGPAQINFQGVLTDANGLPIADGDYAMTLRVYGLQNGGLPLWEEEQTVAVAGGIYNVILGNGTTTIGTLDQHLFSGDDNWLEVEINGEVLSPRQKITSVPYAFQAGNAATVGGVTPFSLEESLEIDKDIALHAGNTSAHHGKTTSFRELTDMIDEGQIPALIARDKEIDWSNLAGIPAGFADNIDNNTTYAAGTGLNLAGTTFSVAMPLSLNSSDPNPMVAAYNNGTGTGVYGWGSKGVYGRSLSGIGVYGQNNNGNIGYLGSTNYAVYGTSPAGYAGYFAGKTMVNGDLLVSGTGKVGINTVTPTETLSVNGNASISGTLSPEGGITTASGIQIESTGSNVIIVAGQSKITVDPNGGVTIESTADVSVQADGDLNLHGTNVNISSDVNTTINAGVTTKVTGNSMLDLNGGFITLN